MTDHPTTNTDQTTGRLRRAWSAITRTDRSTDHPEPTAPTGRPTTPDWSGLTDRRAKLAQWSDRAVDLAANYHPEQATTCKRTGTDRLRLVPPIAALGTAFVMQTVAVTDTVGGALATSLQTSPVGWLVDHSSVGYLAALLLGVAVASCAEGGAAYLMDLYDKHLLARDSVWVLRLAMLVYVAGSAAAIHWWAAHRHLPGITSWLLAGMSASALFLWSRGSRWRNREAMRAAGQLDPALPKLPMAAKLLHPIRWAVTLYLVSWEPVATTDEARSRYEAWHADRADRRATKQATKDNRKAKATDRAAPTTDRSTTPVDHPGRVEPTTPVDRTDHPESTTLTTVVAHPTGAATTAEPTIPTVTDQPTSRPAAAKSPTGKRPTGPALRVVGSTAAVVNASKLRDRYGDQLPTSMRQIRTDMSWSKERVDKAVEAYRAGADQTPTADDEEREAVVSA